MQPGKAAGEPSLRPECFGESGGHESKLAQGPAAGCWAKAEPCAESHTLPGAGGVPPPPASLLLVPDVSQHRPGLPTLQ